MSLNYHQLFKQMAATPQVKAATKKKAEKLRRMLEIRWPEVHELSKSGQRFLDDGGDEIIRVTEATEGTNRPVQIVTVRHPRAVEHQANTGFVTKAVKDAS